MAAIPDVPEEIDIQLQRTDFIERKLIDRVPDEHFGGVQFDTTVRPFVFQEYPAAASAASAATTTSTSTSTNISITSNNTSTNTTNTAPGAASSSYNKRTNEQQ